MPGPIPIRRSVLAVIVMLCLHGCATDLSSAPPEAAVTASTTTSPFVEVPDPLAATNPVHRMMASPVPAVAGSVGYTAFGTSATRVTGTERLRHAYSRHDPFSRDQRLVLLQYFPEGEWRVYRTTAIPYDVPGQLVRTIDLSEPTWDRQDSDALWGLRGLRIVRLDVLSGRETVIKDFTTDATIGPILRAHPDIDRITMKDEGEPSLDMTHWAFLLTGTNEDGRARWLFSWNRETNRVEGVRVLSAAESRIDWVGMSPRGTYVLIGGDWDNAPPLAGLTLSDRGLTRFHRLDYGTAHADVGLSADGREIVVMQNTRTDYIDVIPLSWDTRPILESGGGYEGTGRVRLIRLNYDEASPAPLDSGVHISCNADGWCVVSTYVEPGRPARNWLDRSIVLARLDLRRPRVIYLAHVHGAAAAYWEETHAALTRDGRRVVWATNWGRRPGEERVWLMQLDVPAAWLADLGR